MLLKLQTFDAELKEVLHLQILKSGKKNNSNN